MTGSYKETARYDIVRQYLPLPVHVDHKTGGDQKDQQQQQGIDLGLQGAVEGDEDQGQVEDHIAQQEIFHAGDPFVQQGIISRHLQKTSDEPEVKKIGQDEH